MKKGRFIMLALCGLSLAVVIGVFIGRNTNGKFICLPVNSGQTVATEPDGTMDYRLDINRATKVELMELPGIGEKLADRIIAYRTEKGRFTSTDELMQVEGIGETKLAQIQAMIRVGG